MVHILKANIRFKLTGEALPLSSKQRAIQEVLKISWGGKKKERKSVDIYNSFYIIFRSFIIKKDDCLLPNDIFDLYINITKNGEKFKISKKKNLFS